MKFNTILIALGLLLLTSCAGLRDNVRDGGSSGDAGMADTPCEDCGKRGDIELKIFDESFYREWNQDAYSRIDSNAVVGVFPALKVNANRPKVCKFCHSFSADAVDFDLARIEDSLFVKAFPKMDRELMLPGSKVPEADSSYIDSLSVRILASKFADDAELGNLAPWIDREGIEQAYAREVPAKLKNMLNEVASRYGLRYLSIPVMVNVTMDTDLGKSGGYVWEILWTLWDARYGELVFLTYSKFTAATTSRIAPEKEWSTPFAARLWKMFSVDFSKLESH
ncbi:MAG: hypothetical protein MJY93_01450 [Fibrobacter sp.]|nr:hypothetical protein [Fibrobacter sp.]